MQMGRPVTQPTRVKKKPLYFVKIKKKKLFFANKRNKISHCNFFWYMRKKEKATLKSLQSDLDMLL
jgi:hypothetical protein